MMRFTPATHRSSCTLPGGHQLARPGCLQARPRSVRAIQLPNRHSEYGFGWDDALQRASNEAYQRGYMEGLLVARQEQLTAAAALPAATSPALAPAAPSTATPAKVPCPECKDTVLRSAIKGLSWRFFSTGTTILLAWLVLGSSGIKWSDMLKLGAVEFCCKYFTYFLHERVWAAIALFR